MYLSNKDQSSNERQCWLCRSLSTPSWTPWRQRSPGQSPRAPRRIWVSRKWMGNPRQMGRRRPSKDSLSFAGQGIMHKLSPSWGRTHLVLYVLGSKFCHTLNWNTLSFPCWTQMFEFLLSKGFPRNVQVSKGGGFLPQGALRCCHLPAVTLMLLGNCFLTFNMCIAWICEEGLQNTAKWKNLKVPSCLSCVFHTGLAQKTYK